MTEFSELKGNPEKPKKTFVELLDRLESIEERLSALVSNQEAKNQQWPRMIAKGVSIFETSWPIRFFLSFGSVLALVAFGVSLYALNQERQVRAEERAERQNESEFRRRAQIASAWQTLLLPVGGNVGKAEAFETIAHSRSSLVGVDLSCANIGHFENEKCLNPAILDFGNAKYDTEWLELDIENVSFDQTRIHGLSIANSMFDRNSYDDTLGVGWHLRNVSPIFTTGEFHGLSCIRCSFTEMQLNWQEVRNFSQTDFSKSSVIFPMDAQVVERENAFNVTTGGEEIFTRTGSSPFERTIYTDAPPLFIKATDQPSERLGLETINSPAIANIFWDLYKEFSYCVSGATSAEFNLDTSQSHWTQLSEAGELFCGFELNDPGVQNVLLQGLRRNFMTMEFYTPDARLVAFECENGEALAPLNEDFTTWNPQMGQYLRTVNVASDFEFTTSGTPCFRNDGFGYSVD